MSDQAEPKKPEEQLKQLNDDIAVLDRLLSVEARKPGEAALLPAAIRIIETLEPAGGKQVPVFPASFAGANDQSPPVYDLAGVEYGEGEDTVRVKNSTAKIPRIVRAKLCALDSPQSQANRMEPAFLECDDLKSLVPQASASIPRRPEMEAASSVLTLPHRVADFRVRLSDKKDKVSGAITAFSKGDCLPLLRSFPTSLIFGFWNSRGEEEQGVKHARILLARIDATDVIPCRRHSLYSGPYSKDEFAEAVLQRPISDEEAKKLSKEGFSAAPSDGLGGVIVSGTIERLALLSLTDIARLHCKAPEQIGSGDAVADKPKAKASTVDELTNAARRYIFALAALAEGHERSKGSHRLRSGCELVAAEKKLENGELQQVDVSFEFRGAKPTNADALKELYFDRKRLVAVAEKSMAILGIKADAVSYNVTAATLTGEIVSADQAAKERAKVEKEAKDAAEKAAKANQDAEAAEKAAESGSPADRKKAEKARRKANDLKAKADEAAGKLDALSSANTPTAQPENSAQSTTEKTTGSAPSA